MASRTPPCPTSEGAALPTSTQRLSPRSLSSYRHFAAPFCARRGTSKVVRAARSGHHAIVSALGRPALHSLNPLAVRAHSSRALLAALGRRGRDTTSHCTCGIAVRQVATAVVRTAPQWPPWGIAVRSAGRPRPPAVPAVRRMHPRPARVLQRQDSRRPPHQSAATATNLSEGGRG